MTPPESTPGRIRFENSIPILRVRNLVTSLGWYVKVLGFKIDWQAEFMASVSRDHSSVMLCQGEQGNPGTWVWFGVGDAGALYTELQDAGAMIPLAPTNFPWAREFHVVDPDGHVLRFGSEPLEDEPFSAWIPWYRPASSS
jgi:catechol 2,3-dioxygenase-like lactoylglutathione lyase family enzyme